MTSSRTCQLPLKKGTHGGRKGLSGAEGSRENVEAYFCKHSHLLSTYLFLSPVERPIFSLFFFLTCPILYCFLLESLVLGFLQKPSDGKSYSSSYIFQNSTHSPWPGSNITTFRTPPPAVLKCHARWLLCDPIVLLANNLNVAVSNTVSGSLTVQ